MTREGDMKVLVLSLVDPTEHRDGGTLRTMATLGYLQRLGHQARAAHPARPLSGTGSSTARLRPMLRKVKRRYFPMPSRVGAKDDELSQTVRSAEVDLIQVSSISQFPFTRHTKAPVWLDLMDVWSDFGLREAEIRRGLARLTTKAQAHGNSRAEFRAARRAAIVTAAGWSDVQSLTSRGIDVHWLPTTLPDAEFGAVSREGDPALTAGFIGNFEYWPNRDAFARLVAHWVQPLRQLGWRVIVAGRGSDTLPLTGSGVEALGSLDNVNDFYRQIDLSLAPMLLGGGIKVKVIESLARGVPVLGTEFAFDGFPPEFNDHFVTKSLDGDFGTLPLLERIDPSSDNLLGLLKASGGQARVAELLATVAGRR